MHYLGHGIRKDNDVVVGRRLLSLNRTICHQSRVIEGNISNKLSHKKTNNLPSTLNFLKVTIAD